MKKDLIIYFGGAAIAGALLALISNGMQQDIRSSKTIEAAAIQSISSDVKVLQAVDKKSIQEIIENVTYLSLAEIAAQQMSFTCIEPDAPLGTTDLQSNGSGIVISPNGYFVTAAHEVKKFIDSNNYICNIYSDKNIFRGKVVAYSPSRDYALMQMTALEGQPDVGEQLKGFSKIGLSQQTTGLSHIIQKRRFADPNFHDGIIMKNINLSKTTSDIMIHGQPVRRVYSFRSDVAQGDSGMSVVDYSGSVFGIVVSVSGSKKYMRQIYVSPLKPFLEDLVR